MKLTFNSGNPIEFAKEDDKGLKAFEMQAYSGALMKSPYGSVIINLQGMRTRSEQTPIFQHHDREKIVGHGEADIGAESVQIKGVVSGVGEAAKEVVETSENGFPWQASVGVDVYKLDELMEDAEPVMVNNQEVTGPALIINESEMYETSFVPLGRDKNTPSVIFSKDAEEAVKGLLAAKTTKEHGDMSEKNKDEAGAPTVEALEAAKQEAATATAERMKSLLAEFPQDIALEAFEAGKDVDAVKLEQYSKIKTRNEELEAEVTDLKAKLEAKKPQAEGEDNPADHEENAGGELSAHDEFNKKVAEYEREGKSTGEAFKLVTKEHPELANKMASVI